MYCRMGCCKDVCVNEGIAPCSGVLSPPSMRYRSDSSTTLHDTGPLRHRTPDMNPLLLNLLWSWEGGFQIAFGPDKLDNGPTRRRVWLDSEGHGGRWVRVGWRGCGPCNKATRLVVFSLFFSLSLVIAAQTSEGWLGMCWGVADERSREKVALGRLIQGAHGFPGCASRANWSGFVVSRAEFWRWSNKRGFPTKGVSPPLIGHTQKGSYSRKGVFLPSRCLLERLFLEPLLRTLLKTLLPL